MAKGKARSFLGSSPFSSLKLLHLMYWLGIRCPCIWMVITFEVY